MKQAGRQQNLLCLYGADAVIYPSSKPQNLISLGAGGINNKGDVARRLYLFRLRIPRRDDFLGMIGRGALVASNRFAVSQIILVALRVIEYSPAFHHEADESRLS